MTHPTKEPRAEAETLDAAIRLARYQLNRGSEDMGVGESDMLRRMVAALPLSSEAEAGGEPIARRWRSRMKGGAWDAWEQGRYGGEIPPFMDVEEQFALAKPASEPAGGSAK
jgi:hypothetical protein